MMPYVTRRVALMLPTMIAIAIVIFLFLRMIPGSVADALGEENSALPPEEQQAIERQFGLCLEPGDQPAVLLGYATAAVLPEDGSLGTLQSELCAGAEGQAHAAGRSSRVTI